MFNFSIKGIQDLQEGEFKFDQRHSWSLHNAVCYLILRSSLLIVATKTKVIHVILTAALCGCPTETKALRKERSIKCRKRSMKKMFRL
jgi:hypothetical protein